MKASRTRILFTVTTVALIVLTAGCGGNTDSGKSSSGAKTFTKFNSVVFPGETYALDYVADKKGYFSDHGLQVSFLKPQNGAAAVQLLVGGQIQGWSTAPAIIYNAAAQGQPVKLAGLVQEYSPYEVLAKTDASWVKSDGSFSERVTSLKGRTIGVSGINAGTDLSLRAALASVGLTGDDVQRVGVGTTLSGLGQLKAGTIDAYVEFTGSGARLISKSGAGKPYISLFGSDVPPAVAALSDLGIAVNSDYAKKHPETVKAWLGALNDARAWLSDPSNLDEATKIVADASYNGDNTEEVKASLKAQAANLKDTPKGFTTDPGRIELQIKELKRIGALDKNANITPSSVTLNLK